MAALLGGCSGTRHIDLYIGEETGPDFTSSETFTTLESATLRLTQPRS